MKHLIPPEQADDFDRLASATVPADTLAEFATAAVAVAGEATIKVGPKGLVTRAVDPANVALVNATLPASYIHTLDAGEGEVAVGADLSELAGRVRWLAEENGHDAAVTLEVYGPTEADDDTALGLCVGVDLSTAMRVGTVPVKHVRGPSEWSGPADDLDLLVDGREIRRVVNAFDEMRAHQVLVDYGAGDVRDGDRLAIRSYSTDDDTGEAYPDGRIDHRLYHDDGLLDVGAAGAAESSYSVDYLTDLVAAFPDGRPIRLRFDDYYPLELSFDLTSPDADWSGTRIESVGDVVGHVRLAQAPRLPPNEFGNGEGGGDG